MQFFEPIKTENHIIIICCFFVYASLHTLHHFPTRRNRSCPLRRIEEWKNKNKKLSLDGERTKKSSFRIRKRLHEIFEFLVFEFEPIFEEKWFTTVINPQPSPTFSFAKFFFECIQMNWFKPVTKKIEKLSMKKIFLLRKWNKIVLSSLEEKKMITTNKEKRLSM